MEKFISSADFSFALAQFGIKMMPQEPLSKHTTYAVGGPAELYFEVPSIKAFAWLEAEAQKESRQIFMIGNGSNLLFSDKGTRDWVVRLKGDFEAFEFNGARVRAGAGVFLPVLIKAAAQRGLGGAEELVGVPGTLGGAIAMNAGTREVEIAKILESVRLWDSISKTEKIMARRDIDFRYRASSVAGMFIVGAELIFEQEDPAKIQAKIDTHLSRRLATQPIGTQNAGSVFKNPETGFAAELITRAGLKGLRIGSAKISEKHANFIVNCGGAKASDIAELMEKVQTIVQQKFGVHLEPEVKRVGDWS